MLTSAGGSFTKFPFGATPTLPTIFTHRDVGNTECPGNAAYAAMDQIRDIAARFNTRPVPTTWPTSLRGGCDLRASGSRWAARTAPSAHRRRRRPRATARPATSTFEHGAIYWSPTAAPNRSPARSTRRGASLGFERGALGLPTSGEIQEPLWIVQNFQHGTLNFDRENGTVTRVIDGVPARTAATGADHAPIQLERFTRPATRA